jgi:hypothetical protein
MHAADMVQKGCEERRNGVFRVPDLLRWEYVANGPKLTAKIIGPQNDVLSFERGAEDVGALFLF